ncbi:MAG: glycosyltransferase family 2 protein [Bdellovibrionales bacterium]|nr:glycosyltransferase family 2 protein [Bdellovibrionales bacterium]
MFSVLSINAVVLRPFKAFALLLLFLALAPLGLADDSDTITIIMPVYNRLAMLPGSIETVLNQTHQNWKLILIDDASDDGTRERIEEWTEQDSRIQLVVKPENGGSARARNLGMEFVMSRYVAFLDSDDLWHPVKLQTQLAEMKKANSAMSYTSYTLIDQRGVETTDPIIPSSQVRARALLGNNEVVLSIVMLDLA